MWDCCTRAARSDRGEAVKAPKPMKPGAKSAGSLAKAIERLEQIAALNDALRRTMITGRVLLTRGVASLPRQQVAEILAAIRAYDQFTPDNDPYGERDFGVIESGTLTVFWKIDCYDLDLTYASPDPADPEVIRRILTVMLAEEY